MGYDRIKILEKSKELATKHEVLTIEELVSFLAISKATFYDFFPPNSDELNDIKDIIELNKVSIKSKLRKNWKDAEAPALQIALYKLCGTDEENHKLNGSKQEVKQEIKVDGAILNW